MARGVSGETDPTSTRYPDVPLLGVALSLIGVALTSVKPRARLV